MCFTKSLIMKEKYPNPKSYIKKKNCGHLSFISKKNTLSTVTCQSNYDMNESRSVDIWLNIRNRWTLLTADVLSFTQDNNKSPNMRSPNNTVCTYTCWLNWVNRIKCVPCSTNRDGVHTPESLVHTVLLGLRIVW